MPDDRSAAALLREVGLLADGPVAVGQARPARRPRRLPRRAQGAGAHAVGGPLGHRPLARSRPRPPPRRPAPDRQGGPGAAGRLLAALPTCPVHRRLDRVGGGARQRPGQDRPGRPQAGWIGPLAAPAAQPRGPARLVGGDRCARGVRGRADGRVRGWRPRRRAGSRSTTTSAVLPWAVWRSPSGARKATGISNMLLPEVKEPTPPPVTRIVTLPPAEADGARDEAKRGRRPAPGRGEGRIASAAAYAAQGSPRKVAEPAYISPEGLERLQAELAELIAQRPEVIKRIATAREHGDLKENAEYHAAREEQGFLEGRINALQAKLKVAVVVAPRERGATVELGTRVRVEVDGAEETVTVVGSAEANSRVGRISSSLAGGRRADGPPGRRPDRDRDARRANRLPGARDRLGLRCGDGVGVALCPGTRAAPAARPRRSPRTAGPDRGARSGGRRCPSTPSKNRANPTNSPRPTSVRRRPSRARSPSRRTLP